MKLNKRFPALSHRDFRVYWTGQIFVKLGSWIQKAAQAWLVLELTQSPFLLGLLTVFQFGPILVFSLLSGVWVDRFPKKMILYCTQTILMLQAFLLAALVWTGTICYWHILILAALLGIADTFDAPSSQAIVYELAGKKDLFSALSLNSAVFNLAKIVGPSIAGLVITFVGTAGCFLLNGLSIIPGLICLSLVKTGPFVPHTVKKKVLTDAREGLKYISSKGILWCALLCMLTISTFAMNSNTIIPVFAQETLQLQAAGYGVLLSSMGIGSLVGAIFLASRWRKTPSRRALFTSAFFICGIYIVLGPTTSCPLSIILIAFLGTINTLFMTIVNSTLQLNSDDLHRGRVMSAYNLAFTGTTPIGGLFTGSIMEGWGAGAGWLAGGLIALILMCGVLLAVRIKKKSA